MRKDLWAFEERLENGDKDKAELDTKYRP